jgi:hypothetical protein
MAAFGAEIAQQIGLYHAHTHTRAFRSFRQSLNINRGRPRAPLARLSEPPNRSRCQLSRFILFSLVKGLRTIRLRGQILNLKTLGGICNIWRQSIELSMDSATFKTPETAIVSIAKHLDGISIRVVGICRTVTGAGQMETDHRGAVDDVPISVLDNFD